MADYYLQKAFEELRQESGLSVMARGCGTRRLMVKFIQQYAAATPSSSSSSSGPRKLVFVIGIKDDEAQAILDTLLADGVPLISTPKIVTFDIPVAERVDRYLHGGVFIATSRILIVDLLNQHVKAENISGIIVSNAHRVNLESTEAFILRVYREKNQAGFIRAFTDEPEALMGEFGKLERTMKLLWVKRLSIWPRNREEIMRGLSRGSLTVEELTTTLTPNMLACMQAILVALRSTLTDLRKCIPTMDTTAYTLENALFAAFDRRLKEQLDPEWHKLSYRAKQCVSDIKDLRKLLELMHITDSITFYGHLLRIRREAYVGDTPTPSPWLTSDSSEHLFTSARNAVFTLKSTKNSQISSVKATRNVLPDLYSYPVPSLEETAKALGVDTFMHPSHETPPKITLFLSVLQEIQADYAKGTTRDCQFPGRVLVLVKDRSTSQVLRQCATSGVGAYLDSRYREFISMQAGQIKRRARGFTSNFNQNPADKKGAVHGGKGKRQGSAPTATQLLSYESAKRAAGNDPILLRELDPYALELTQKQLTGLSHEGLRILLAERALKEEQLNRISTVSDSTAHLSKEVDLTEESVLEDGPLCGWAENEDDSMCAEEEWDERGPSGARKGKRGRSATADDGKGQGKGQKLHRSNAAGDAGAGNELQRGLSPETIESGRTHSTLDSNLHLIIATHDVIKDTACYLEDMSPSFVVLYDGDVAVVRMIEVYAAARDVLARMQHSGGPSAAPIAAIPLHVFFLFYESSLEENIYVTAIAREKKAFESLITAKAKLAICLPDIPQPIHEGVERGPDGQPLQYSLSLDTRTVRRGTRGPEAKTLTSLIVDIREFRSVLPSTLYAQGIKIIPRTLNVADYVLAAEICVERKSVSDLFESLRSGRLFHQAEAMSKHYRYPSLLIEFTEKAPFCLHIGEYHSEIRDRDISSQLVALVLAFPNLRILWSRTIHATPDIFTAIAAGHDPVDEQRALEAGQAADRLEKGRGQDQGSTEREENQQAARSLLLSLPGVNPQNMNVIMDKASSLRELSKLSEQVLCDAIGRINGRQLYSFFRQRSDSIAHPTK